MSLSMTSQHFHAPVRPYGVIDAHNRMAAALGSPRYAKLTTHADYNGHHVRLTWNSFRSYYVAEYTWAGRVVLARGGFAECLRAALREYDRGALGAAIEVALRDGDEEAQSLCEHNPNLLPGTLPRDPEWLTWRHRVASRCAPDSACRRSTMIFDHDLLAKSQNENMYCESLRTKYGRIYQ